MNPLTNVILFALGAGLLYQAFTTPGDQILIAFAGGFMTTTGLLGLVLSATDR